MNRYLIAILFIICTLPTVAQGKLVFDAPEWDFGTIRESDGKVSHIFTAYNRGDKPLVLLDVVTSCGCTLPDFSRQPILPGQKSEITVVYDPSNRPGAFSKALAVYSSDKERIATLTVRGKVIPRERTVEELYPLDVGGGLRFNSSSSSFSYLYIGRPAQSSIGYVNASGRTLMLQLRPVEQSGLLTVIAPQALAPGERGEINFGYLIPAASPRYGAVKDLFEVVIDGKTSRIPLLVHGIGVDDPTVQDGNSAPKSRLSKNIVKFGAVKHAAAVQSQRFELINEGDAPLIVRAVEYDGAFECSLRVGDRVAAGQSRQVEVTFLPRNLSYGVVTGLITLITNDTQRPMRKVRVTTIIED